MRSPTWAELEKLNFGELRDLAGELAEEDEQIKKIRGYFMDKLRSRIPERAIAPGDLGEGQMAAAVQNGSSFLVAKVEGKIFALDNRCPHRGFPLHYNGKLDRYTVTCAFHGAQFDIRTGACLRHPAETYPCDTFRIRSDANGTIVCEAHKDNAQ
jgi:nitrite reductase/ring-hydroxylating ferredoxin subunit